MTNFKKKVANGAIWTLRERPGCQRVGFVVTMLLSRLLLPSDCGRILGLIGFYVNDLQLKVTYVSSFVASQETEDRGLARQLFEQFLKVVKSAGMEKMGLNVWNDNPRAIAFYTKMGLRVVGCGTVADHWLMNGGFVNGGAKGEDDLSILRGLK